MKKRLLLSSILLAGFVHAQTQFASQTIIAYSSVDAAKGSGKILPTTPLEVIKTQEDRALIKLTGWNQGKQTRILYFSQGERIISAAFSKKAKYEIKTLKSVQGSKKMWNQVELTTWVENKELIDDIKPLYEEARTLLETNCGLCHAHHPTEEFSANQWPSVIKGMIPRTPLSKEQGLLITQYAQKHAKK